MDSISGGLYDLLPCNFLAGVCLFQEGYILYMPIGFLAQGLLVRQGYIPCLARGGLSGCQFRSRQWPLIINLSQVNNDSQRPQQPVAAGGHHGLENKVHGSEFDRVYTGPVKCTPLICSWGPSPGNIPAPMLL